MSGERRPGPGADPIPRAVERARSSLVTGLGESIHHTAEHPELRRAFLAELLAGSRERGDSLVVALEAVPPGPNPIDDYVTAAPGAGTAVSALIDTGVRMWRNESTVALVETLRRHNDALGRPVVRVHGIDVLTPARVIARLLDSPVVHVPAAVLAELTAAGAGLGVDGVQDQRCYDSLPASTVDRLSSAVAGALVELAEDEQELRVRLGVPAFLALRRDAVGVRRSLTALAGGRGNWMAGLPARDRAMAENVADLVRAGIAARYVVLGHNSHIAASASLWTPATEPMGAWLRRWFGREYTALGTTFGTARFDPPIYGWSGTATADAEDGSIDSSIAAHTDRAAWLAPLEPSPPDGTPLRSIGAEHPAYRIETAFDALIHVPTLSTATQLVPVDLDLTRPG